MKPLVESIFDDDEAVEDKYSDPTYFIHNKDDFQSWLKDFEIEWTKKELTDILKEINNYFNKQKSAIIYRCPEHDDVMYTDFISPSSNVFSTSVYYAIQFKAASSLDVNWKSQPGFRLKITLEFNNNGHFISLYKGNHYYNLLNISPTYKKWFNRVSKYIVKKLGYNKDREVDWNGTTNIVYRKND